MTGTASISTKNPSGTGLAPFQGAWDFHLAGHLLRRTLFGPDSRQISWSVIMGLEATVDNLLASRDKPGPPLHYKGDGEPMVDIGQTWVDSPYRDDIHVTQMADRSRSLYAWNMGLILDDAMSIREKMVLFWHNHFAIRAIEDPRYLYRYTTTIREHATGNFRALIRAMTIDPSMLIFLNGNRNHQEAPNENYARELLELFTVGKGDLAGAGDYSTFTEQDVKAIARSLTGWQDEGFLTVDPKQNIEARFTLDRHDKNPKILSHRFDNLIITNNNENEYQDVIDILLGHPATAVHLCSRIYCWFVEAVIDDKILNEIINPLANILRASDYEITPVLKALFLSEQFYRQEVRGTMVKSPVDLLVSLIRPLGLEIPSSLSQRYDSWYRLFDLVRSLQMDWYELPQVAGWDAYYRAPLYYRHWLNAATLPPRIDLIQRFLNEGYPAFEGNGPRMQIVSYRILNSNEWTGNTFETTRNVVNILLPVPLTQTAEQELSLVLNGSSKDITWSQLIDRYEKDASNVIVEEAIKERIATLVSKIVLLPEFQLT